MSRGGGYFAEIKFCPKCGCGNLQKDKYRIENNVNTTYPEFTCTLCGFGFLIKPSLRWEHALGLFKRDRRLRPSDDKREIPLAGDSPNEVDDISTSGIPEQMDQARNQGVDRKSTPSNRVGDNEEVERGPNGESFPEGRSQSLAGTSSSSAPIRGEDKKGESIGEQIRRLLGPSWKRIIYY